VHQNIINEENAREMDDSKVHEDAQNYEQMNMMTTMMMQCP